MDEKIILNENEQKEVAEILLNNEELNKETSNAKGETENE